MKYRIRNNVLVIKEEANSSFVRNMLSNDTSLTESVKNYYKLEYYEHTNFKFKVMVSVLNNNVTAISIICFKNEDIMNRFLMENL